MKWSLTICLLYLGCCLAQNLEDNVFDVIIDKVGVLGTYENLKDHQLSRRSLRRLMRSLSGFGQHLPHIESTTKNICIRNGREVTEEQLDESINKMKVCLKEKPMFLTPRDEFLAHLDYCTRDPVKTFTSCLPEKLKYFPKFIFKLVHSLVKLLYDDFSEIGLGLGPCVDKLKSLESESRYNDCVMKAEANDDEEIPTSQAKFCEKFIPLSRCFVTQMNETCQHNPKLDKFSKDYMKAMKEPCESTD